MIALAVVALLAPPMGRAIAAGADAQQEGLKVHGDWTIEVRDPDGTLVTRRQFQNSLAAPSTQGGGGKVFLAQLLKGTIKVEEWMVAVGGSPRPCGILNEGFQGSECFIIAPNSAIGAFAKTLAVTLTGSGDGLELSGSVTAERNSSINLVTTYATLATFAQFAFTAKDLSTTPIGVAAGQIIQVKVVISFSS
jgi:hypothetical protein